MNVKHDPRLAPAEILGLSRAAMPPASPAPRLPGMMTPSIAPEAVYDDLAFPLSEFLPSAFAF
jgi:hypothetical protein